MNAGCDYDPKRTKPISLQPNIGYLRHHLPIFHRSSFTPLEASSQCWFTHFILNPNLQFTSHKQITDRRVCVLPLGYLRTSHCRTVPVQPAGLAWPNSPVDCLERPPCTPPHLRDSVAPSGPPNAGKRGPLRQEYTSHSLKGFHPHFLFTSVSQFARFWTKFTELVAMLHCPWKCRACETGSQHAIHSTKKLSKCRS